MRTYNGESLFDFDWQKVFSAFWQRYPNSHARHVLSEDTIWRKVTKDVIHSVRLLRKTNRVPKWGERFITHREVLAVEESILNRSDQTLVTYTRNVDPASTRIMTIDEKCYYSVPGISTIAQTALLNKTAVHRQAWFDCHKYGFVYIFETFAQQRYKQNATNANKGFLEVLANMYPNVNSNSEQKTKKGDFIDGTREQLENTLQTLQRKKAAFEAKALKTDKL